MTIKFKKGKSYPTIKSILKVFFATYSRLLIKGELKVQFYFKNDALYKFDHTDQADVLKLLGFKSVRLVKPKDQSYWISSTEKIIGFRRKSINDNFFEIGIHERVKGVRQKFIPTKAPLYKRSDPINLTGFKPWYIPAVPYFGGNDSDGNGIGGKAPHDIKFKIKFI